MTSHNRLSLSLDRLERDIETERGTEKEGRNREREYGGDGNRQERKREGVWTILDVQRERGRERGRGIVRLEDSHRERQGDGSRETTHIWRQTNRQTER